MSLLAPAMSLAFEAVRARVEAYELDGRSDVVSFADRLRKETGWNAKRAARAIAEYRRFVILAVSAGHPVSPSREVDAVWHLHLTDTQRYWDVFCPDVLGVPLHHRPSRGGSDEADQLARQYAQTLDSYERLFGETAPSTIWPRPRRPVERARATADRVAEVMAKVAPLSLAAALAGCAQIYNSAAEGAWDGPTFAAVYLVALITLIPFIAWVQPIISRTRWGRRVNYRELSPYELAYVSGGPARILELGVLRLWLAGAIQTRRGIKGLLPTGPQPESAGPIEAAIYGALGTRNLLTPAAVGWNAQRVHDQLTRMGLATDRRGRARARLLALGLLGPLLALGAVRLGFGLANDRPVAFLGFMLFGGFMALLVLVGRALKVNARGARVRRDAEQDHPPERSRGRDDPGLLTFAALYGLVGLGPGMEEANALRGHLLLNASSSDGGGGGGGCSGGGCGGGCGG